MEEAEVIGLEKLDENERNLLIKILTENYIKIQRKVKNDVKFKVQIKTYKNDGPKKKYSVNFTAVTPMKSFKASEADWEFPKVMHNIINKILTEVEHEFRASEQK